MSRADARVIFQVLGTFRAHDDTCYRSRCFNKPILRARYFYLFQRELTLFRARGKRLIAHNRHNLYITTRRSRFFPQSRVHVGALHIVATVFRLSVGDTVQEEKSSSEQFQAARVDRDVARTRNQRMSVSNEYRGCLRIVSTEKLIKRVNVIDINTRSLSRLY